MALTGQVVAAHSLDSRLRASLQVGLKTILGRIYALPDMRDGARRNYPIAAPLGMRGQEVRRIELHQNPLAP